MNEDTYVQLFVILGLIFSIILHEIAHAVAALWSGDDTAYLLGRITLNPIPHIHPVGTILVPLVLYMSQTGIFFGWANPVPVQPWKFKHRIRCDIFVSMAGIVVNLILAFISMALYVGLENVLNEPQQRVFAGIAMANVYLAFFNLLPIPPLDGSHVFKYVLPRDLRAAYMELGFGGLIILILAIQFTPLGGVLQGAALLTLQGMQYVTSLPYG